MDTIATRAVPMFNTHTRVTLSLTVRAPRKSPMIYEISAHSVMPVTSTGRAIGLYLRKTLYEITADRTLNSSKKTTKKRKGKAIGKTGISKK